MSKIAILFLLSFCSALIATFISNPVFGFYIYELIYFLNPESRWWNTDIPTLKYSFITVTVMWLAYGISYKNFQNNTLRKVPESKWLLAIAITFLITTLFAINRELHIKFIIEYFKMLLTMYVAFKLLDSEKKLQYAIFFYFIGASYIGLEAFNVGRDSMARVEGIGMVDSPDSNTTAASLVPTIPLLIYYAWQSEWKTKILILCCCLLIVNGLILINSRGAFLGCIIGAGYFLIHMVFSKYKVPHQKLMLVLISIAILLGTLRLADNSFWNRMNTIESSSSKDSEGSGGRRINFWLATIDMMKDHPLGLGISGYQTLSPFYLIEHSTSEDVERQRKRAVHSIWFQSLSEIGWHGLIFFILLLLSIKRHLGIVKKYLIKEKRFKQYYLAIALEGSFIGFLISASFIDLFRIQVLYWLILFCLVFCIINTPSSEKTEVA
ncbi:MAG: O-antigen ligase family protein [Thalassotalea sp.]|nr:O-antigen ligase family protein [Thalassotalea sp.]